MPTEKKFPETEMVLSKFTVLKTVILPFISKKRKLLLVIAAILLLIIVGEIFLRARFSGNKEAAKTLSTNVNKSYEFTALDNLGKKTTGKIKLKVTTAEKTNQVLVKDQVYTAKNNKLFLIVNLELRDDATTSLNILPGDVIRLSLDNDKETRYAPDLHNNLVPVAAISTKVDRIGFVIPDTAQKFYLFIGEIEGEKQEVSLDFPS